MLRLCCGFCMLTESLCGCTAAMDGCLAAFLLMYQLCSDPTRDLAAATCGDFLSASLYFLPKRKRGCFGVPSPVSSTCAANVIVIHYYKHLLIMS